MQVRPFTHPEADLKHLVEGRHRLAFTMRAHIHMGS